MSTVFRDLEVTITSQMDLKVFFIFNGVLNIFFLGF